MKLNTQIKLKTNNRKVRIKENQVLACAERLVKRQGSLADLKLAYAEYQTAKEAPFLK